MGKSLPQPAQESERCECGPGYAVRTHVQRLFPNARLNEAIGGAPKQLVRLVHEGPASLMSR
jgi:hypothetical protein